MNIIYNFLEPEVIKQILQKYEDSKDQPVFEVNSLGRWGKGLDSGNYAPVMILPYPEMKDYFVEKFSKIPTFDNYEYLTSFLHVWPEGSGINWHTDNASDGSQRIGITIYLNEFWDSQWGGLFLYEEPTGRRSWYIPFYNSCVWFESPMWHSVSLINKLAPSPRLSMQLFFKRK
jgi:Rps23 Pro-64 3,4-dihydroxylase Tpa1-like proline 4-hydroxylase